jgi:dual specificity tyrosine-phosphorylation-regulated kinase 2/3/4
VRESVSGKKDKDAEDVQLIGLDLLSLLQEPELVGSAITSSDGQQPAAIITNRISKKTGTTSARSSFTPKRGSASSTNYTTLTTTSSRDSAPLSSATSATSVSTPSGRYSTIGGTVPGE